MSSSPRLPPCMQNGKHTIARGLINGIGFGTTEFHVVRPEGRVTSDWVHRFLRQPTVSAEAIRHFRGAVGQQRVPKEFLMNLTIPLPPLSEQERIVATLNEQMAAVERAKKAAEQRLEAAQGLREASLRQSFRHLAKENHVGYPRANLADVCTIVTGNTPTRSNPGFPILGVFRLKGQPKRDGSIIVRSCKATQSPVNPIRDAFAVVEHPSCPSSSSSCPLPVG